MRFRLLERQRPGPMNSAGGCPGYWKPVGGVREAEGHEDALRQQRPTVDGEWLVLCETDSTWRIFRVRLQSVLDVEAADGPGELSNVLVATR
jgi:hypothetical protein